jgi:hypothetical protein
VKGNVPVAEATRDEAVLPERVQEALGELVGAAKEGLLALSVGVGLKKIRQEVTRYEAGPAGRIARAGPTSIARAAPALPPSSC